MVKKVLKVAKKRDAEERTSHCPRTEESNAWKHLIATMRKHFILYDEDHIHVVMGAMFANRLDQLRTWLYLVGQASGGKTTLLEAANGHDSVKFISRWTEQTMISGRGKKGGSLDGSLLPELDGRVLVIKDLTSALSMNQITAQSILGELRDAYDGKCSKGFGVKEAGAESVVKDYASRFGLIAGVTHSIDKQHKTVGELGERFLLYRMPDIPEEAADKACLSYSNEVGESVVGEDLRAAAHAVLDYCWGPVDISLAPAITPEQIEELRPAAKIGARLRAYVPRDHRTKQAQDGASVESPVRLSKQLCNLARGMSWAKGLDYVHPDDIRRAKKVAMHGCTRQRKELLEYLLAVDWEDERTGVPEPLRGYRTIDEIADDWERYSREQMRILLDDLVEIKLAERMSYQTSKGNAGYRWRVTSRAEYRNMLDILREDVVLYNT